MLSKTIQQLEYWALSVIERVEKKQPVEDDRVELKREWPKDPNKVARHIAAHANASRGDEILWLFGIDEDGAIPGVEKEEFSNWFFQVEAEFNDRICPTPTTVNIPHNNVTVLAVRFETNRSPFLVKNARYGNKDTRVAWEVPWREANSTRTATRNDLLKILVPKSEECRFSIEAVDLSFFFGEKRGLTSTLNLIARIFVDPFPGMDIPFLNQFSDVNVSSDEIGLIDLKEKLRFYNTLPTPRRSEVFPSREQSSLIFESPDGVVIQGPGYVIAKASGDFTGDVRAATKGLEARFLIDTGPHRNPLVDSMRLTRTRFGEKEVGFEGGSRFSVSAT